MSALPGSFGKNSIYLCISLYVLESMHASWRWAQIECLLLIFPIFASRFPGYSSDFTSISLHSFSHRFYLHDVYHQHPINKEHLNGNSFVYPNPPFRCLDIYIGKECKYKLLRPLRNFKSRTDWKYGRTRVSLPTCYSDSLPCTTLKQRNEEIDLQWHKKDGE